MKKLLAVLSCATVLFSSLVFASHDVKVGSLKIEDTYARATVPAQKMSGGFMKIENSGSVDKLVSASSTVAGRVELHSMTMDGNVMKMREIKSIEIPERGEVRLAPGGLHLMFIDLKQQLKDGDTVPVKLKFEKAGEVEVKFHVKTIHPAHGEKDHDHSKHH